MPVKITSNVFSFKLLDGNKDNVLTNKNSIVISDELAKKLFGTTENITGKPIRFQQSDIFYVSGVFEKTPYHSSQQFDFVLNWDYFKSVQDWVTNWDNVGPLNFVLLKKGTRHQCIQQKNSRHHCGPWWQQITCGFCNKVFGCLPA